MSQTNAGIFSQQHFAEIPSADVRRSTFDRGSTYKTTFDSGYLVPIFVDEVLPGDTFDFEATLFGRLNTPIVPFFDDLFIDTHFFFVPNRLVWDNWENFITGPNEDNNNTEYLVPQCSAPEGGFPVQGIQDYFGVPPLVSGISMDAMPLRAYNLIYNEWYRDENLISKVPVSKGDGPDDPSDYKLLRRGKRKDYFTSALPWPQKGPGVEFSLGQTAPVVGNGMALGFEDFADAYMSSGDSRMLVRKASSPPSASSTSTATGTVFTGSYWLGVSRQSNRSGLVADLSAASAVTINSFRMAYQMQAFMEQLARGGSRYIEVIRTMFNVVSPDARLQRPEYLGGSSSPLELQTVAQTSATDGTTPQGNLAAYGVFTSVRPKWEKSFVEHGYIIGICSVRSNLTYQQGIPRMFSRRTRYDYYWPAFAHLGEQAILRKEIFATGTDADDEVFGYQERNGEYRFGYSKVTGKLRSTDPQSLDVWHLSQKFETAPTLSADFINENPPVDRVIAVQDEPEFFLDCRFDCFCTRPMPVYAVPGLITHL